MVSLLGRGLILMALSASVIGAILGFTAGYRRDAQAWKRTRVLAGLVTLTTFLATLLMEYALLARDFSVAYVAQVGSHDVPDWIAAVSLWSSLEGSILFWSLVLGLYTGGFAWRSRANLTEVQAPYSLATLLLVNVFFHFLVAGIANPFAPVSPVPTDGPGPNPLLQNHVLMIIHPPSLYLGFVGMSVPFAMACGALLAGKLDLAWMSRLRRWMLLPWSFLSLGIMLGGWWSYEVLGWGGYWAWDPVENASFMPWLTATAFLHSALVMERRGQLRSWTLSLALVSFLLTLLGTFMTRSGVFNSVHSFTQSDIGPTFLVFIAICLIGSLLLLSARMAAVDGGGEGEIQTFSKSGAFLLNNLLFTAFTFTVLLGTLFPLLNEALTSEKVSVGQPYFNKMTLPICAGMLLLMGVAPVLPWGQPQRKVLQQRLLVPLAVGLLSAGLAAGAGMRGLWPLLTIGLSCFSLVVSAQEFTHPAAVRARKTGESFRQALAEVLRRSRRKLMGHIVHAGIFVLSIGIAASSSGRLEEDVRLMPGESAEVGGYTLTLSETRIQQESHLEATVAAFQISSGARQLTTLEPRLNQYPGMNQPIPTPDVRTGPLEDLYLSLIRADEDSAVVKVIVEPLVSWVWLGGLLIFLGGIGSIFPMMRRATAQSASSERPEPARVS